MHSTISIANATSSALQLVSSVNPVLPQGFKVLASSVPAGGTPTAVISFDRGGDITNGDTWIFSTTTEFDGVNLALQEKVTGTHPASKMAQDMTASNGTSSTSTGYIDTNDPMTISVTGSSGTTYSIVWTLTLNATLFYDILYTITAGSGSSS